MISILNQWRFFLSIGLAFITSEQIGFGVGWASPVLINLQSPNSTIPISSAEGSWLATILFLFSGICAPVGALLMHYLGRKISLLISILLYGISWIVLSFASRINELIIARVLQGIGQGIVNIVISVYLGEVAPNNIRGGISIGMISVVNFGILWMYIFGTFPKLWISSLNSIIPIIIFIIFYNFLLESPYYLLQKGEDEKAKLVLKKLKNYNDVDKDINEIKEFIGNKSTDNQLKMLFKESNHRRALFICILAISLGQLTGGITFIFYAHLIFLKAGNVSPNTMTIIKAVLQFLTSIAAAYIVDKVGRKPLLIISCFGSAVFMCCQGIYFYLLNNNYNVNTIWWMPLMSMICFNIFQAIGLGPIPKLYLGELFHSQIKTVATCVCESYWTILAFAMGRLYQIMSEMLGDAVPFFIFAVIGLLGMLFVVIFIPETKGRSLHEIQYNMKHKHYQKN